jgi:iron complex transport system substrate-binding protein
MKKKLIVLTVILTSVALLLAGCQKTSEPTPTPTPAPTATPAPTPEDTTITVIDSQGTETILEKAPETVVSLAPNITEIIFAVGEGSKLVARTDWCNYPEESANVASVGNIDQPDVEAIIALAPDVVILTEMTMQELALQIKDAGIPIIVVDEEDSFDGAYACIEIVGKVLGADEKAAEVVADMTARIEVVKTKVSGAVKKTVYYVMGYGEYGDYTAAKGTFISEMIAAAGGINVADDTEGWTYSVEKLVEHNPDLLLLSMWAPADGLKEATGYKDLTAVKEGRLVTLDDDTLQRLGPRLADAFEDMAKAIHPDLFE